MHKRKSEGDFKMKQFSAYVVDHLDGEEYSPKFEEGKTYRMGVENEIVNGVCVVATTTIAGINGRTAIFRIESSKTKNPVYVAGRVRTNDGVEYINDDRLAVAAAPGIFDDDFEEFIGNLDDIED